MKKLIILLLIIAMVKLASGQASSLNGVTFGFSAGYSHTTTSTYDYSLTTDKNHDLKLQPINKNAFVISSVVMVKLFPIAYDPQSNSFVKQSDKSVYNHQSLYIKNKEKELTDAINDFQEQVNLAKYDTLKRADLRTNSSFLEEKRKELNKLKNETASGINFWHHLAIDLSLDLVNVSSDVSFNKSVSGGLGIGYFITDNVQLAFFYDVSHTAQLRDYIVDTYQNKPIPNGKSTYTTLSTTDNNLYYSKLISGPSFKIIFSLSNKKAEQSSTD